MRQELDNVVLVYNDPQPPVNTTARLAKRKGKTTMTDSRRMSQLEDIFRNIDQPFQEFMAQMYEVIDVRMAEASSKMQTMVVDTIKTLLGQKLTPALLTQNSIQTTQNSNNSNAPLSSPTPHSFSSNGGQALTSQPT